MEKPSCSTCPCYDSEAIVLDSKNMRNIGGCKLNPVAVFKTPMDFCSQHPLFEEYTKAFLLQRNK